MPQRTPALTSGQLSLSLVSLIWSKILGRISYEPWSKLFIIILTMASNVIVGNEDIIPDRIKKTAAFSPKSARTSDVATAGV